MLGKEVLDKVTSHMTMLIKKKGNKDGGALLTGTAHKHKLCHFLNYYFT
jgi:hypothetical protein